MTEKEYVMMLEESLEKKKEILLQIRKANARQKEIYLDEASTPEELEENFDEKDRLIGQMTELDDGFEVLYEKVKAALDSDRASYAEQIRKMQNLIREITDVSNEIQMEEQRNKALAEKRFSNVKKQVQKIRKSQKVVNSYYQNMMKRGNLDPQFMDHKE